MHDINTLADTKAIEHELAVRRSVGRARLGPVPKSAGTGTTRLPRLAGHMRRIATLVAGCWEADREGGASRFRRRSGGQGAALR